MKASAFNGGCIGKLCMRIKDDVLLGPHVHNLSPNNKQPFKFEICIGIPKSKLLHNVSI